MKKFVKNIFVVVILLSVVLCTKCTTVEAASEKGKIQKLMKAMENYEWAVLQEKTTKENNTKIHLNKENRAKAAALSLKLNEKDALEKGEFGGNILFKISNNKLKKAEKNMFGTSNGAKALAGQPTVGWNFNDAYKLADGTPVVYAGDGETELNFHTIKTIMKKNSANSYIVTKKVYHGYWGYDNGTPNIKIVYSIKKSKKSIYGYVISKMAVSPIR